jgi:hypothetical protein
MTVATVALAKWSDGRACVIEVTDLGLTDGFLVGAFTIRGSISFTNRVQAPCTAEERLRSDGYALAARGVDISSLTVDGTRIFTDAKPPRKQINRFQLRKRLTNAWT